MDETDPDSLRDRDSFGYDFHFGLCPYKSQFELN